MIFPSLSYSLQGCPEHLKFHPCFETSQDQSLVLHRLDLSSQSTTAVCMSHACSPANLRSTQISPGICYKKPSSSLHFRKDHWAPSLTTLSELTARETARGHARTETRKRVLTFKIVPDASITMTVLNTFSRVVSDPGSVPILRLE